MGQTFARALEQKGYEVLIAGRKTKLTSTEAASRGDLVIVCVPISVTEKVIKQVGPFVRKEAILTDFTSIKTFTNKAMCSSTKSGVVGAHPIFGPVSNIEGQTLVVCPERISKTALTWYKEIFKSIGLMVVEMTADEHDRQMGVVQCLNHLSNLTLAHTLKNIKFNLKSKELFSPAFLLKLNLIKRLLAQDSSLYAEIETYNPYAKKMAEKYLESLIEIKKSIDKKDQSTLEKKIKKIQQYFEILNKVPLTITDKVPNLKISKNIDSRQVGILGPEYSHSHLLAKQASPNTSFLFCSNIEEVFRLVSENKITDGIVPIENMLNGSVKESILALKKYKIKINHLYHFPIHHCFASKSEKFSKIISHTQAIAQCSKFLEEYRNKGVEILETTSTSRALEIASGDSEYAAIGSSSGAEHFGLKILKNNIENNHKNITSFIAISKKESVVDTSKNVRTSVLLSPAKDYPGLLYEVLSSFKQNKINLTKIESIPTGDKIGEYVFYLEFDGNLKDATVQDAIQSITALYDVYILGSYLADEIA